MVRHALGGAAALAGHCRLPEAGADHPGVGAAGPDPKRHAGGTTDAGRQGKTVGQRLSEEECVRSDGRGNDGRWKSRKTKVTFSGLPPALGNRECDSHIPTAATAAAVFLPCPTTKNGRGINGGRGKVEIERHASHFSTAPMACGARKESVWCASHRPENTPRKETPAADYFFLPPGSFFDENMLADSRPAIYTAMEG